MISFKKIFSKNFPYYLAFYLNVKSQRYLNKVHKRREDLKEQEWLNHFKEKESFIHDIDGKTKIILYKDSVLSKPIFEGFEVDEIEFMQMFLKEGDTFIDIGANIGLFSLMASGIVGDSGKVICYEPSPTTFTRLQENISLNNFRNIEARNIGLSDTNGILKLNISESGYEAWNTFAGNSQDNYFQKAVEVNVSALDDELTGIDKSKISLLKIDVEGWEKFVLKGASRFFSDYSPVLMIEFTEANTFSAGYLVQDIYDMLQEIGYSWISFREGKLFPAEKKLHYPYENLIACRDITSVEKRLH